MYINLATILNLIFIFNDVYAYSLYKFDFFLDFIMGGWDVTIVTIGCGGGADVFMIGLIRVYLTFIAVEFADDCCIVFITAAVCIIFAVNLIESIEIRFRPHSIDMSSFSFRYYVK